MKKFWQRMSLRGKIMFMGTASLLLFALITLIYFIPSIREDSLDKKRRALMDTVDISMSLMDALKFESENGRMTEDEAANKAVYYTGKFRYGPEKMDTVWLLNSEGVIYSMPYREDIVGKNVAALNIPGKRNVYNEMLELCRDKGEGFVEYSTQYKSEVTRIVPAISYVRYYKPYNLIIGASIYIDDVEKEIMSLYIKVITATLFVASVSMLLLFIVSGRIVKPLRKIADAISESNLNTKLETGLEDEIGLLVDHFNAFVGNIRGVILEIKDTSGNLAASAEELSAISVSFSGQTEEQNRFSAEVSVKVLEITHEVEAVASQIDIEFDRMNNLIRIMNTLSEIINRLDESAAGALSTLGKISESTITGETSLKRMLDSFSRIGKRSDDMNEIVTMINSISDNINLLSLNAAIEAARAGDAGRGFAVVADEISKLADATSQSINHISRIISDNDRELKEGFANVEVTVKVMGVILNDFGSVREWIEGFSSQVKEQLGTKESVQAEVREIRDMSDNIRRTTREQKSSVLVINDLMERINKGTETISAGSEELAAGAEEVAVMSENLKSRVSIFNV
ncbi:MAG TPA: methyl-accepting chemotaxis protein [Spirochaetota bacterium]|nr:methyl-accepting chemotaxis protein [Spirochaetota bacterium]